MVQFNIDSRHVEDARFKKVLFGYDGDLLEVEVNELQDIFNSRINRLVDEVFGSRPLYTGTYAVAGGNLTLTNELVAINRELIFIPSATLAVANGDTVYLNYQDKTITTTDTIKQYGNLLGAGTVANYLQDSRMGKETTRRVQASYQLTKTNVGTGTFLKLCTITAGAAVKNTADYPDSDLYKEIRRLADAQITASGLATALANHKTSTTDHAAATSSANGFMSSTDKAKLDGIATGAEVNQNTFGSVTAGGTTVSSASKTGTLGFTAGNGVTLTGDNSGKTVNIAVPNATQSVAGALSAADKTKLDGISAGAEVNQNTFGTVSAGGATLAADAKNDTLTIAAGNAVTITGDAPTDTVTITVANATTSTAGALSAADKTKLDGIATGAEVNQNTFGSVVAGGVTMAADAKSDTLNIAAGNAVTLTGDASTDTVTITVANATQSVAGALSAADKTKLDGIATGAEVNQNTFSTVTVAGTALAADTKSDTLTITAGTAVVLTPDAANDAFSIGVQAATASVPGYMSAADKSKLDGIASGASGAQNIFQNVLAGGVTMQADSTTDTLNIAAGSNVTITGDASTDTVTIAVPNVTTSVAGAMSAADKSKLDGIAAGATNYTHPANHPPSIITQDASNRFVTDTEKATWNAKASTAQVTTTTDGLMIAADKVKLNGVAAGAEVNQNTFSTIAVSGQTNVAASSKADTLNLAAGANIAITTTPASDTVTIAATGLETPSGAQAKADAAQTAAQNFAKSYGLGVTNLPVGADANTFVTSGAYYMSGGTNLPAGADTYGVLVVLPASGTYMVQIYYSINYADKTYRRNLVNGTWSGWTEFATTALASGSANGLMLAADKTKLDGVAANANNYTHPANHPPSIITQDSSNRFVTDSEKAIWNGKASISPVTTSVNGLMIAADKAKLDGIAAGAEVNQNAFATIRVGATDIVADVESDTLALTSTGGITLAPDASGDALSIGLSAATTSAAGSMSAADKTKLDGIAAGAEVNQNSFANVVITRPSLGSTTLAADSKQDTLTITQGTGIILTPDSTTDGLTIQTDGTIETTTGSQAKVDAAIAALPKMAADSITTFSVAAGASVDKVITYPAGRFSSMPSLTYSLFNADIEGAYTTASSIISTSGATSATIRIKNKGTSIQYYILNWHAIEIK